MQITMLFMQTTFKYCAKYTIIHLLEEKEISIMYIQGGICMISFLVCLALLIGGYFVYDQALCSAVAEQSYDQTSRTNCENSTDHDKKYNTEYTHHVLHQAAEVDSAYL